MKKHFVATFDFLVDVLNESNLAAAAAANPVAGTEVSGMGHGVPMAGHVANPGAMGGM